MTLKVSTGLRNAMLDTQSLKTALALGFIKLYSGAVPATADAAVTGTLLTTISVNSTGTGLSLATAAASGTIAKASEVWSGVNAATGTATYFRFIAATGDDGTLSTTQKRLQGTVGTSGADLNLSSVNLTATAVQTIDAANITLPTF
ncbi:MAG: hypothetical protein EOP82_21680 [Variovorax sp.]|nr:MAG: hypothetical protein EOP82_21680 [Variovorax sp.]